MWIQNPAIYFNDEKRRIDFILAWKSAEDDASILKSREVFERNLRKVGLQLENDEKVIRVMINKL